MGFIPNLPEPDGAHVEGPLFLICAYGFLLLQGANQISDGSELLLQVLDPGLIGGLLLPILGALPDSMIILMSGMGDNAQEQVAVGMGTLAGSTIMLLTIAWAGSVTLGRCDLVGPPGAEAAKDRCLGVHSSRWSLSGTGVTTDAATRVNSYTMFASSFLYLIIVVPALAGYKKSKAAAWTAMVASLLALAAYCAYQVLSPDLQKRKMQAAKRKTMKLQTLYNAYHLLKDQNTTFIGKDGTLNTEAVDKLFTMFDADGDGALNTSEVKALMTGMAFARSGSASDIDSDYWINELDIDKNGKVERDEFCKCLENWMSGLQSAVAERTPTAARRRRGASIFTNGEVNDIIREEGQASDLLLGVSEEQEDEDSDDEEGAGEMTTQQIYTMSLLKMVFGTGIVFLFSDPMVDALTAFAHATGMSPFIASFVICPFASNASELVSSLAFAAKKRRKNISLTFSQVYGAVTMNNTMCFAVFMTLFALKGLEWTDDFDIQILVMMVSIWLLSFLAMQRVTFPLWTVPVIMLLYPFSLVAISVATNINNS